MKIVKYIYKLVCICILSGIILSFGNNNIVMEAMSSNTNTHKNINLNKMANVIKTFAMADTESVKGTSNGILTGYVADCPLCNGHLACNYQDVRDRTTTYYDEEYKEVRIVAASFSNLKCGSIVQFDGGNLGPITAIVLDTGVTGTNLDLLVASYDEAVSQVGRKNIDYDILRFGWPTVTT